MRRRDAARMWGQPLEVTVEVEGYEYSVYNPISNKSYEIKRFGTGWWCSCPDAAYRHHGDCKHVHAVVRQMGSEGQAPINKFTAVNELATRLYREVEAVRATWDQLSTLVK